MGGVHHGGDGCQYSSYHSRVVNWCKGDCIGKLFRSGRSVDLSYRSVSVMVR